MKGTKIKSPQGPVKQGFSVAKSSKSTGKGKISSPTGLKGLCK